MWEWTPLYMLMHSYMDCEYMLFINCHILYLSILGILLLYVFLALSALWISSYFITITLVLIFYCM
jgi:hypothetical protein